MTYALIREDGIGDSGGMSMLLIPTYDADTNKVVKIDYEHDGKPRLGVAVRVGSNFARTFDSQDWWQTTVITEIIEEREDYVKFKTTNSIYEWRKF